MAGDLTVGLGSLCMGVSTTWRRSADRNPGVKTYKSGSNMFTENIVFFFENSMDPQKRWVRHGPIFFTSCVWYWCCVWLCWLSCHIDGASLCDKQDALRCKVRSISSRNKKRHEQLLRCRCCDDHIYTDHRDLLSYATLPMTVEAALSRSLTDAVQESSFCLFFLRVGATREVWLEQLCETRFVVARAS